MLHLHVSLNPGDKIYKYELKQPLGAGGFGYVWLAFDSTINKEVALKILPPTTTIDERLKEARIGNQLAHDNLVKVHYADVVNWNSQKLVEAIPKPV